MISGPIFKNEHKTNAPATRNNLFFGVAATPFFQAKRTDNQPGDAHEHQADAVADQVMRMQDGDMPIIQRMPILPLNNVQRACADCEKEDAQRKETGSGDASGKAAPSIVADVISSGGGQQIEGGTRQFMESRFGQDFSQVRVHTDSKAAESAHAIQARAYTSGRNVVFGAGEYQPNSDSGKRLLAHELVHVGQQTDGVQRNLLGTAIGGILGAGAGAVTGGFIGNNLDGGGTGGTIAGGIIGGVVGLGAGMILGDLISGQESATLQRGPGNIRFQGCAAIETELQTLTPQALTKVDNAITQLSRGIGSLNPAQMTAFNDHFDPSHSGTVDEGFINEVKDNYIRIRNYMNDLTFNCGNRNLVAQSTDSMCVGGRLAWTIFGHLNICMSIWQSTSNLNRKIETIIHESVHNALEVTDRAYHGSPEFSRLTPRGNSDTADYGKIPGFRRIVGLVGNDTLRNPDSYAGFAMVV